MFSARILTEKQILHLFTEYFCQHPLYTEKDGKWTPQDIMQFTRCTHSATFVNQRGVILTQNVEALGSFYFTVLHLSSENVENFWRHSSSTTISTMF